MSETKFTPGPWWVLHEGSSEVSVQADKACICSLNYDPLPKEETKKHLANARLIAAAPEMYWELVRCANLFRDLKIYPVVNVIEALLRKACGESEVKE